MGSFAYTAMTGMRAALAAQDVTAHNIANASTTGFRKDIGTTKGRELSGGFGGQVLAAEAQLQAQMSPGEVQATGRPLDLAIGGDSMLAVQAADGTEAYTRRGDLKIDANGLLVNGDGVPVIGSGGPVTMPPAQRIDIAADGTISIQPLGAGPQEMVAIDTLKLATPDPTRLAKGGDGLFHLPQGETADADPEARVTTGSLEGSNVNAMAAMIDLLDQSRNYELQVKMLGASRELDQSSAELMRLDN